MKTFIWLISHFSCRLAVLLLGIPDALWLYLLNEGGKLKPYIICHKPLLITVGVITLLSSTALAFIGGKAGYQYVDMERSGFWRYRSSAFTRGDNTFRNTLYWIGKFALLPIILVLLAIFIQGMIGFVNYC